MSYIYTNPSIKQIDPMKKLTAFVFLFGMLVGFGVQQVRARLPRGRKGEREKG